MVYECECCGLAFRDYDECRKHEDRAHVAPRAILEWMGYQRNYHADSHRYPMRIRIRFSDGSAAVYRFEEVTELLEHKKGADQDGEAGDQ
jgi:hypothetical protein